VSENFPGQKIFSGQGFCGHGGGPDRVPAAAGPGGHQIVESARPLCPISFARPATLRLTIACRMARAKPSAAISFAIRQIRSCPRRRPSVSVAKDLGGTSGSLRPCASQDTRRWRRRISTKYRQKRSADRRSGAVCLRARGLCRGRRYWRLAALCGGAGAAMPRAARAQDCAAIPRGHGARRACRDSPLADKVHVETRSPTSNRVVPCRLPRPALHWRPLRCCA